MATFAKPHPITEPFYHSYYATAGLLSAEIEEPLKTKVDSPVLRLSRDGGYEFRRAESFRIDGIISYEAGYEQVAGFRIANGFTTLTTSVIQGVNILDVITADRVVGQIATEHPFYETGQVPSVSFMGTRFDNLRINGHKVEVKRCLDILGCKPASDKSYFEEEAVLQRISDQHTVLPSWVKERWSNTAVHNISQAPESALHCSLVSKLEGCEDISFGHVIDLPFFGKIFLAELRVTRKKTRNDNFKFDDSKSQVCERDTYSFHLDMMRVDMHGMAEGGIRMSPCDANGQGSGGEGGHG